MMKVLVSDPLSEEAVKRLREHAEVDVKTGLKPEELIPIIGDYDALAVRSQTQVTAEVIKAGQKLQIIGRAGVGIDNIDVEAATQQGIIVVNAPTGNTVSAAEHAIALMFALARNIPRANTSLKGGEWRRSEFMGTELRGKTLGLIGLGNVGSEVARRVRGLEMKLIGHDPFVSDEYAKKLQVELVPMEQLLKASDFISLHLPLTPQTKGLIGAKELALIKPTARIINTARGALIDEEVLANAVKEKKIAGAAVDVFPKEPATESPLFGVDNIIVTPHLGASTTEAQVLASTDIAEQIIDVAQGKLPRYAVNAAFIPPEMLSVLAPLMNVASLIGRLVSQLAEGQMKAIKISYDGEVSECDTNVLKAAVLGGLLENVSEERVTLVNADLVASRRGLKVVEKSEATCENYASLVTAEATTSAGTTTVAGTVIRNEPHIVQVNNYWMDIVPTRGYFLFADHLDRPGLIGAVGKVTGDADINISAMHVSRLKPRGKALMVLALDEPLTEAQKKKILAIPNVDSAKVVKL
ncbi:MAG: phosphoglycerate dehydrogenase [Dehalococcoidia bacterium]|nr:MAG: phosphoglycerate dehydrogenase [Dehalococcoidia bacterium]